MSEPASDDPVERTRRQLACYYHCVSRDTADEDVCEDCGHHVDCPSHELPYDDDDALWNPPL